MSKPCILIVEDEALIAWELRNKLESWCLDNIYTASTGDKAIQLAKDNRLDLIFMDIILKGNQDGIKTSSIILELYSVPIIYMTGNVHLMSGKKLIDNQTSFLLEKPVPDGLLINTIKKALGNSFSFQSSL